MFAFRSTWFYARTYFSIREIKFVSTNWRINEGWNAKTEERCRIEMKRWRRPRLRKHVYWKTVKASKDDAIPIEAKLFCHQKMVENRGKMEVEDDVKKTKTETREREKGKKWTKKIKWMKMTMMLEKYRATQRKMSSGTMSALPSNGSLIRLLHPRAKWRDGEGKKRTKFHSGNSREFFFFPSIAFISSFSHFVIYVFHTFFLPSFWRFSISFILVFASIFYFLVASVVWVNRMMSTKLMHTRSHFGFSIENGKIKRNDENDFLLTLTISVFVLFFWNNREKEICACFEVDRIDFVFVCAQKYGKQISSKEKIFSLQRNNERYFVHGLMKMTTEKS